MRAFSCAWSLPVTWQRWRSHHSIHHIWKPHRICKLHGSVCYRNGVTADRSFTSREKGFPTFLLLWPWHWPDDLHIRTWPVFTWDVPDGRKWTSYVKAFESYRLTDIQTDRRQTDRQTDALKIIYQAASQVVNNLHVHTARSVLRRWNVCEQMCNFFAIYSPIFPKWTFSYQTVV